MFDTYIRAFPRRETHVSVRQDVHEHRAPTDESVRLLKEFEEKADSKRIGAMQLGGNKFSGAVEAWDSALDGTRNARAVFELNGHRYTAAATADRHDRDPAELIQKLHKAVSDRLASAILGDLLRGETLRTLLRQ